MDDTKLIEEVEIQEHTILRTTDIAHNLNIAESTVRKYCQILEEQGYTFRRDENGGRVYTDHDQVSLLEMLKLRKEAKMGLDAAANVVALRRKPKEMNVAPTQNVQPSTEQQLVVEYLKNVQHEMRLIQEQNQQMLLKSSEDRELLERVVETNNRLLKDNARYLEIIEQATKNVEALSGEIQQLKEQQNYGLVSKVTSFFKKRS